MDQYSYSQTTGELRNVSEARPDPLETIRAKEADPAADIVWLEPANTTFLVPPLTGYQEVACFVNGAWEVKTDRRGETWYTEQRAPVVIDYIGNPADQGLLETCPEKPLDVIKSEKIEALRSACADAITAGYASAALGNLHYYPASEKDQRNMIASVLASFVEAGTDFTTPFWCCTEAGVWGFTEHTAVQIRQAGADGKRHIIAQQRKLIQLLANVVGAHDAETVNSIEWA